MSVNDSGWVSDQPMSFLQLFSIKIVKTGRVPQHLALIMDGNRRYAKKVNKGTSSGHSKGFDKLSQTLRWCLHLGIPEVTVYAFSIENFKRSEEEVIGLMDLAREKFRLLLKETEQMADWGVTVCVSGRLSLLPPDLQELIAKVMLHTKDNNKLRLNIAYSYTARDEISRAASQLVAGVASSQLSPDDIDEELVSQTLELTEPELLIRTSGEIRLSDFMLWQLSNTVLYFTDVLWPEFSIWDLLAAILHFQRHAPRRARPPALTPPQRAFLHARQHKQQQYLNKLSRAVV